MGQIIKHHWPLFAIAFLEVLLFAANYTPGTYFLGWDNLFPEMNFTESFKRSFFGVWQEYRGLGLLDGMSFAANLPHYIFLFLLSFFLPEDLLRYFFIFFMHFLGGAGVYLLIKELAGNFPKVKTAALFGALFYLFNVGTVQMFFAPYEVFTVHFAFLPILILFLIKFLKRGLKKHLLYFLILSFLSAPQAHVPTLFIIFLIALFAVLLFHLVFTRKKGFVRVLAILIVTFSANSFWGLPYMYSALNNAGIIADSKINQMATDDIYLKNKASGDFSSVVLMKGFALDFVANQQAGGGYMMDVWRKHTKQPFFLAAGFALFAFGLFGVYVAVKVKQKQFYPFILMFLPAFFMLADDTPLIGTIPSLLRSYIPFFDQIFRFTFTKFFILYAFSLSILMGFGAVAVLSLISKVKNLNRIFLLGLLFIFVSYSLPVWQGNFLYSKQRIKIPQEYFQLVDYFNKQDKNTRVALLPQTSLWGWTYTAWGYEGSGFIWYGIQQASLDGAFYPWSRSNENYYWELSQAFFQKDKTLFESVLDKYQIGWVVVDRSLRGPSSDTSFAPQIQEVIEKSDKVKLESKFGELEVYKVNLKSAMQNFTFAEKGLPMVGPGFKWDNVDQGYFDSGNYISTANYNAGTATSFYPFRSLFTLRQQQELEFKIEEKEDYFSFKSNIPKEMAGGRLVIPAFKEDGVGRPEIYLDNELIEFDVLNLPFEITLPSIREGVLEVRVPKVKGFFELEPVTMSLMPKVCNQLNKGIYRYGESQQENRRFLKMESVGSDNCLNISIPNIMQKLGYLVTIESNYIEGKSLLFAVINQTSQRADLEVNLPKNNKLSTSFFVIPPMESGGIGYTLFLNNISFGRVKTVNNLGKITMNPIPYQFLKSLKVVQGSAVIGSANPLIDIKTDHPNPSLYNITVNDASLDAVKNATLVLSQSFDKGWKAYATDSPLKMWLPFLFGKELKEHVLVNNWANGWVLSNPTIVIVYWPQYLEYFGFGLLFTTSVWMLCLGPDTFSTV